MQTISALRPHFYKSQLKGNGTFYWQPRRTHKGLHEMLKVPEWNEVFDCRPNSGSALSWFSEAALSTLPIATISCVSPMNDGLRFEW
jgi:hypothetical protein